jgi:hypothetical protein
MENILKHEIYTGYKTMTWRLKKYEIAYYEGANGSGVFRERYRLNIEPVIDYETYEKVCRIRQERSNY